jgi:hypothetical protein
MHEQYILAQLQSIARRNHKALAQAIELEEERVIVAVKCMKCNNMISAYGYSEHVCAGDETCRTIG